MDPTFLSQPHDASVAKVKHVKCSEHPTPDLLNNLSKRPEISFALWSHLEMQCRACSGLCSEARQRTAVEAKTARSVMEDPEKEAEPESSMPETA